MRVIPSLALRVHCTLCAKPLFTIRDTRFGQPPAAVICRDCTLEAFADMG